MDNYDIQDLLASCGTNKFYSRYIVSASNLLSFPEEKLESIILAKLGTEIGIGLASDPNRKYDLIIDIDPQTFYRRYTMRTFCFSKDELISIITEAYRRGRQDSIENSLTFSENNI